MSETPPSELQPEGEKTEIGPPPELMPKWVPIAIGVILVSLAGLAVITGLRYRDDTLARMVKPRRPVQRVTAPAPPGEPEAGASLILSGEGVPASAVTAGGAARAEITGGRSGVSAVVRLTARRGINIAAVPSDAVVYVNDVLIGQARQFDSEDEIYDFANPGSYTVRVAAPGYKERQFIVTASDHASDNIAVIRAKLEKE